MNSYVERVINLFVIVHTDDEHLIFSGHFVISRMKIVGKSVFGSLIICYYYGKVLIVQHFWR